MWLAMAHACGLVPFLRSKHGRRGLGIPGVLTALLIPLWAGATNSHALLAFWWIWLAAVAYRRTESSFVRWRGAVIHSQYLGYPWMTGLLFRKERRALAFEPLLCLGVGYMLRDVDLGLSTFIGSGFLSLGALHYINREIQSRTTEAYTDAVIEAQNHWG